MSYKLLVLCSNSREFFFIRVFKGVLSSELVDQEETNANGNQQKPRLEASKPSTYFTTDLTRHHTLESKKYIWGT